MLCHVYAPSCEPKIPQKGLSLLRVRLSCPVGQRNHIHKKVLDCAKALSPGDDEVDLVVVSSLPVGLKVLRLRAREKARSNIACSDQPVFYSSACRRAEMVRARTSGHLPRRCRAKFPWQPAAQP